LSTTNKNITDDLNLLKKSILIKDNKNSLFSSYHHTTNLGVWSYIDGELILTPFEKEVLNVKKTTTENSNPLHPILKPIQEQVFKENNNNNNGNCMIISFLFPHYLLSTQNTILNGIKVFGNLKNDELLELIKLYYIWFNELMFTV